MITINQTGRTTKNRSWKIAQVVGAAVMAGVEVVAATLGVWVVMVVVTAEMVVVVVVVVVITKLQPINVWLFNLTLLKTNYRSRWNIVVVVATAIGRNHCPYGSSSNWQKPL